MKFLIIGLGNIGDEYAHTRHNIGFDVLHAFVQKHGGVFRSDRHAFVSEIKLKGRICFCILPTTFMNLSGKAFKYWIDKEKISVQNTLTILDDIALPLEKLRLRPSGSDAGHNGLTSIEQAIGTKDYPRMRFGVGNNYPKGRQVDFVLGKWKKEEEPLVQLKINKAVEAIETFVLKGLSTAMNQTNNQAYSL